MHKIQFVKEFIRHPSTMWSIAESSKDLAELITDRADLSHASVVVEFGSGTGVFTEMILKKISVDATVIALEINPVFVEETRRRCSQATVFQDSAVNTAQYLRSVGVEKCDRIISGLPWSCFSHPLQDQLLDTIIDVLAPGGRFLTFAYIQGLLLPSGRRFRRCLSSRFKEIEETHIVWKNMPPAFVYCAKL
ncbi:MAG: methyltransferase domain-containing protein [Acidobacteriota bacterium]|nr:methyltransferase domain-containing protein [Acidobacteriota bacterium]